VAKRVFSPDLFEKDQGVDVLITFFCDVRQFSAKKLAFFLKINSVMQI
jgi:hypothetical protein